jgi:sulfur carrier protein ThiS adenylyltransferase
VTPSNLNRQFYFIDQLGMKKVAALRANLARINPDLDLQTLDIRLDAGNVGRVFAPCDIIVEALDQACEKKMMADAFMSDGRLLVCASGIGGWGNSDRIRTRQLRNTFYLIGDGCSEVSEAMPPVSTIVGIAAAKQADVVVETILKAKVRGSEGSRVQVKDPPIRSDPPSFSPRLLESSNERCHHELHHPDGRRPQGHRHPPDEYRRPKGEHRHRHAAGTHRHRQGDHSGQQEPHEP